MLCAGWARNRSRGRRCDDLDQWFIGRLRLTVPLIAVLVSLLVLLVAAVTTATAAAATATAAVTFAGALAVAVTAVKRFRVVQGRVGTGGFLRLLPPQTLGRLSAVDVLEELVYVDCLLDRLGWPFTNGGCCAN